MIELQAALPIKSYLLTKIPAPHSHCAYGGKALRLPLRKAVSEPKNVGVAALDGYRRSLEAFPALWPVAVNDDRCCFIGWQFGEIKFVLAGVKIDGLLALLR